MSSILVTVFVLQLAIYFTNTIGAGIINAILWHLYNRLPIPTSKAATDQRRLQKEYFRLRKELNETSSQDEFAKWARLRRQHDKVLEQLEKTKGSLVSAKATFDSSVTTLRWLGTNGLIFILQWWYINEPMFWLPRSWLPYYAEWLLSFPRAPLGSVSIQAWVLACGAVIVLVVDAMGATIRLVREISPDLAQKAKVERKTYAGAKSTNGNTPGLAGENKKEL